MRVLVVGDFILDKFIWGKVERISPEAPVPVVDVQRESFVPGGALNVANNIHALGGKAIPCGVVGADPEARILFRILRQKKIEQGGVLQDSKRPTTVKTRIIAHAQHVVRFDRELAADISPEALKKILQFVRQKLKQSDGLIIEDYGKVVIQPSLLKKIIRLAWLQGKPVLVDPKDKNFPYYTGVTLGTPNRKEAYEAFGPHHGTRTLEQVGAGILKKLKCRGALVTLGEKGMALFEQRKPVLIIPAFAREVFDVSGAGDTVIAAMGLALASGAALREAAFISNLAAGIVVGKLGTATASIAELLQIINSSKLEVRGSKKK